MGVFVVLQPQSQKARRWSNNAINNFAYVNSGIFDASGKKQSKQRKNRTPINLPAEKNGCHFFLVLFSF